MNPRNQKPSTLSYLPNLNINICPSKQKHFQMDPCFDCVFSFFRPHQLQCYHLALFHHYCFCYSLLCQSGFRLLLLQNGTKAILISHLTFHTGATSQKNLFSTFYLDHVSQINVYIKIFLLRLVHTRHKLSLYFGTFGTLDKSRSRNRQQLVLSTWALNVSIQL